MNEEQIKELFSDEAFVASVLALDTPEEVQAALKERGLDVTLEEIDAIQKALVKKADGELADDDLEDVAGGSLTIMAAIGIASIIGASVAGGIKLGDKVNEWTRRRW